MGKIGGPIERIDHPPIVSITRFSRFFRMESRLREQGPQCSNEIFFTRQIGLCNESRLIFLREGKLLIKVAEQNLPGLFHDRFYVLMIDSRVSLTLLQWLLAKFQFSARRN